MDYILELTFLIDIKKRYEIAALLEPRIKTNLKYLTNQFTYYYKAVS